MPLTFSKLNFLNPILSLLDSQLHDCKQFPSENGLTFTCPVTFLNKKGFVSKELSANFTVKSLKSKRQLK